MRRHAVSRSTVLSSIVIADENIIRVRLGSDLFFVKACFTGNRRMACHRPLSKIRTSLFEQRNDLFLKLVNHGTTLHPTDSIEHG